jgi:hypothetical protein
MCFISRPVQLCNDQTEDVEAAVLRHPSGVSQPTATTRTIDCDQCVGRATNACQDCVVTFLLSRQPDDAVILDATEELALRRLAHHGLVPALREERVC